MIEKAKQMVRYAFLFGFLLLSGGQNAFAGVSSDVVLYFGGGRQATEHVAFDTYGGLFWGQNFDAILVTYSGPRFQFGDYYSLNVHVGLMTNWPESGRNYMLFSVWQTILFGESRWSLFTESTVVPGERSAHYVGTYVLSFDAQYASLGAHAVQFDTTVSTGPRLKVPISEHFGVGLQYHWYVGSNDHVLRLALHLNL